MKKNKLTIREYKELCEFRNTSGIAVPVSAEQAFYEYLILCTVLGLKSEFSGTAMPEHVALDIFKRLYK